MFHHAYIPSAGGPPPPQPAMRVERANMRENAGKARLGNFIEIQFTFMDDAAAYERAPFLKHAGWDLPQLGEDLTDVNRLRSIMRSRECNRVAEPTKPQS